MFIGNFYVCYKLKTFFSVAILSWCSLFASNVLAASTPGFTVNFGTTQLFDGITYTGSVTNNFSETNQTYSYNTVDEDGNTVSKVFSYSALNKTNSANPWAAASGGISSYEHYEEFLNSGTYNIPKTVNGGAILNNGTIEINNIVFANNKTEGLMKRTSGYTPYYLDVQGGAIYNKGKINENGILTADFVGNSVIADFNNINTMYNPYVSAYGGAIFNEGTIGNIKGNFISNYASSSYHSYGGAIFNEDHAVIGNIDGHFIDNHASASYAHGGAIYNDYNSKIGTINGDFAYNYAEATDNYSYGGAIYNNQESTIEKLKSNFIGNYATSTSSYAYGGAIYNHYANINSIEGNFIENYSKSNNSMAYGGAIYNFEGTIGDINGTFISNYAVSERQGTLGGAINNSGTIADITGDFINNYTGSNRLNSYGGAINNTGNIGKISGDFIGNYTYAANVGYAFAGALYNDTGTIAEIDGSFINNYTKTTSAAGLALGGAIYSVGHLTFNADNKTNIFSGNYTEDATNGKRHNAIFVDTSVISPNLEFKTSNNGSFIIDDTIEGGINNFDGTIDYSSQYDISFSSDGSGKYFVNNDIINAGNITVSDATLILGESRYGKGGFKSDADETNAPATSLTLNNAELDINNNYIETIKLKNYTSNSATLHLNIDYKNGSWIADKLEINGDINGTTNLIVHTLSNTTNEGSVVFAEASNDTVNNSNAFSVYRVYGSPYMWDAVRNMNGNEAGSVWYLSMNNELNPDYNGVSPRPQRVTPEVISYLGLHGASLEQTRSMIGNVKNKSGVNKILNRAGMLRDESFYGYANYNLWINPIYYTSSIKKPFNIESDIWGVEAGYDLQANLFNKMGLFASYRQGEYDFNGKGDRYYSSTKSKIDIDSYMGGLYYRHDYRNLWIFATLYGGVQKADIKTNDGISADTEGTQFGGGIEIGYNYILSPSLMLEPSLGVIYTSIDFDDIKDEAGKDAKFGNIYQTEIEAGIKLEKQFRLDNGTAKIYAKPSVVKVIAEDSPITITGLEKTSTYKDGTFGRIELGARYVITTQLSTYGWINYTFGSNYDATSLGLGLNYSWQ